MLRIKLSYDITFISVLGAISRQVFICNERNARFHEDASTEPAMGICNTASLGLSARIVPEKSPAS